MGIPAHSLRQLRRGKRTAVARLRRRTISAYPRGKLRHLQTLSAHHRPHHRRPRHPRGGRFGRRAVKLVGRGARLHPHSGQPAGDVALFDDRTEDTLKNTEWSGYETQWTALLARRDVRLKFLRANPKGGSCAINGDSRWIAD